MNEITTQRLHCVTLAIITFISLKIDCVQGKYKRENICMAD